MNMGGGNTNSDEQHRDQGSLNCPSLETNTNPMSESENATGMTVSAYPFYGLGWDPLNQNQGFGGNSHSEFAYPGVLQNQGMSSDSHLLQYLADSSFVEMAPKLLSLGSGGFSEMVGSFGLSDSGAITTSACPPSKEAGNSAKALEEGGVAASTDGKKRKRVLNSISSFNPHKNAEGELEKDVSGERSQLAREENDKEQSIGANLCGKHTKDESNVAKKDDYVHVRARKGQATNSHSLAERVRREKISERMKLLQEIVPGCNKITGKAVMLDEIINYVQSLQQQVEFLSMKLATVNPELNIDITRVLSKDVLHSCSGFGPSQPFPHEIFYGAPPSIPNATQHFPPLLESVLDPELQNLFQMRYDPSSASASFGPNGRLKSEQ